MCLRIHILIKAINVYYSIIAKLIVQTLSRSVFCAELPILCPVSYALRETNKGNYLSPSPPSPPMHAVS